jgi:hypothetical protein
VARALKQNFAEHKSGRAHWAKAMEVLSKAGPMSKVPPAVARQVVDAFSYYYMLDALIWTQIPQATIAHDQQAVRGAGIPRTVADNVCNLALQPI